MTHTIKNQQMHDSKAGYMGALIFCISSFSFAYWLLKNTLANEQYYVVLAAMLLLGFLGMFAFELSQSTTPLFHMVFKQKRSCLTTNRQHFFRSVVWRYLALLLPWCLMNLMIQQHYYFQVPAFAFTRFSFEWIGWLVFFLGLPYVALTLYFRGASKYDYNDYAVLTLLLCRALLYRILGHKTQQHILKNHRSKKLLLSWLVTLFFLSLMFRFMDIEFNAFKAAFENIAQQKFAALSFFKQYHAIYLLLYHLIFVIDVGVALIAYTVANRWLDNRVRSVDTTLKGWIFALMCYPPINAGFTGQFFGYDKFQTERLVSNEWVLMLLMALILSCFCIYVWATTTLGFKFSNLCNRGIVTSGPYQYLRHPAYTTKNIAWWLDNTYVFSNVWAVLAMLIANLIYIMRGLTEEKHLKHDSVYKTYCQQVQGKFWPTSTHKNKVNTANTHPL